MTNTLTHIISELKQVQIQKQNLTEKETALGNKLIENHGKLLSDEQFFEYIMDLKHCLSYNSKEGIQTYFTVYKGKRSLNDFIDFVYTYQKKVKAISTDQHYLFANKYYEALITTDESWYDFTDYLPLQGKEVYDMFLKTKPDQYINIEHHEEYISCTLQDTLINLITIL